MKKKIILIVLLVFAFFAIYIKPSKAAVSCPSGDMSCTQLSVQGGCASGCVKVQVGGGRGPSSCHCEVASTTSGLSCGADCQTSSQCGSGCPFCRAANPTSHATCTVSTTQGNILCGTDGILTAIGCIPVLGNDRGTAFSAFLLRWAVGVGSGIAFILILYSGFMIMTSQGNPDRLQAGKELLTSAISGLILILLSVFILKFIGLDILGLGAFGFGI